MGCNRAKRESHRRRKLRATTPGSAGRTFFSKYTTHDRTFTAALRSSDQQHRQQPSQQKPATVFRKNTHRDTNEIPGQSVQAKNVNINATDMFLAVTAVQQIMTELCGAATEKRKGYYHN
jgi:hypothetical protein